MVLSTTVTRPVSGSSMARPDVVADGPSHLACVDCLLVEQLGANLPGGADELLVSPGLDPLLAPLESAAQHRGPAHLGEGRQHRQTLPLDARGGPGETGLDPPTALDGVGQELGGSGGTHPVHDEEKSGRLARHRDDDAREESLEVPDGAALGVDAVTVGLLGCRVGVASER